MFTKIICKAITKIHAPEISLKFTDEGSTYNAAESIINLDLHEEEDSKAFLEDLKANHYFDGSHFCMPLWSLLHELGHYNNDDTLDEDELDYDEYFRYLIATNMIEPENYYKLPKEFEATEWAVSEIRKHHTIYRFLSFLMTV